MGSTGQRSFHYSRAQLSASKFPAVTEIGLCTSETIGIVASAALAGSAALYFIIGARRRQRRRLRRTLDVIRKSRACARVLSLDAAAAHILTIGSAEGGEKRKRGAQPAK